MTIRRALSAFAGLFALLVSMSANASNIPMVGGEFYSSSASSSSTTSTSFVVSSDIASPTGTLVNGKRYLVFYRGVFDGSTNSAVAEIALDFGTGSTPGTTIALASGEGTGGSSFAGNGEIQGIALVTGDGTNGLRYKFRCLTSSTTCFFNGLIIHAIELDDPVSPLVENTDWLGQFNNSLTATVSNVGNTYTDVSAWTPTTPGPTQNWILCGSVQLDPDAIGATDKPMAKLLVDGTIQSTEWRAEAEDVTDLYDFAMCREVNLTGASHTIKWQFKNEGTGATVDAYRANYVLLREASFATVKYVNNSTTGKSFTGTTYDADQASDYLELSLDPVAQQMSALALATVQYGYTSAGIPLGEIGGSDSGEQDYNPPKYAGRGLNHSGGTTSDDEFPTLIMRSFPLLPSATPSNIGVLSKLTSASGTGHLCKIPGNASGIECNMVVIGLDVPQMDAIVNSTSRLIPPGR